MATLHVALFLVLGLQLNGLPRLGHLARELSAQDISAIERALPAGQRAWLLVGPHGQIGVSIEAYLRPDVSNVQLRRGPLAIVRREAGGNWVAVAAWTDRWAQVALSGRDDFDAIEAEQDLNRPFMIAGSFDDAELVSLVRFVRGNATLERTWPIHSISRQPDSSTRVFLWPETGSHLQIVNIVRRDGNWVVVSVQKAIA